VLKKPGPRPFKPTSEQRRRVELAIATGMTLPAIAAALDISRSTLSKLFAAEIGSGRAKRRLENVCRLDKQAAAGNTAATKALLVLIDAPASSDDTQPSRWDALLAEFGVAPESNSGRISDFRNGH
jgi:hypothetical protein